MEEKDVQLSGRRPMEEIFGSMTARTGMVYGLAFDKASEYLREVLHKMSQHIGWKDVTRPFDFVFFSGYYPDVNEKCARICHGDSIVAEFFPLPGGRLGFKGYGEEFASYPKDVNPWYPLADIMDGKLCLEKENLEKACKETFQGHEVVYGLRYGDDTAVCCRVDDAKLRSALVVQEPSILFVGEEKFGKALDRWMERDYQPGFEGEIRPELIRFAWDGASLVSEKELLINERDGVAVAYGAMGGAWSKDWAIIDELRLGGERIRAELESAAGITEGRNFKFANALYPSPGIRDDVLFLSSNCGRDWGNFLTSVNGNISLYREYNPYRHFSEPIGRFLSVADALDSVRKVVLGEKNISLARKDYLDYTLGQRQGQDQGEKVGKAKDGMKIH